MRRGDAFGLGLLDAYRGAGRGFHLNERDDGYIDASASRIYFTTVRQWGADERRAMRYVRGRVLDVGCGAGRHSLYLQRRGHDVTGIGISPLVLRVARLRGLRRLRRMSVTDLGLELPRMDTILMLGNNFGVFGSRARAQRLLRRWSRLVRSGTRIVAQSRDPYATDNPWHRLYHRRNRTRGRMAGQIRMRVRYQGMATPWFDYLLVSPDEMREIVAGTGWVIVKLLRTRSSIYTAVLERRPD